MEKEKTTFTIIKQTINLRKIETSIEAEINLRRVAFLEQICWKGWEAFSCAFSDCSEKMEESVSQFLNKCAVNNIRQNEIQTAQPLLQEPD